MHGNKFRELIISNLVANAYLTNINFPASFLTSSTSFQDSFKVFLVSEDSGIELVFDVNAGELLEESR